MKNLFKKDKNTEPAEGSAENAALGSGTPENNGGGSATKSGLKLDRRMILIIAAACLAVVCVVLAIVLPVCLTGGEGDYFKLTYNVPDGVKIVIKNDDGADAASGWEVKSGTAVSFGLEYEAETLGEPIVTANDRELTANGQGVYSFNMNADTVIKVTGVIVQRDFKVTFDRGQDGWVRYASEKYDVSGPVTVKGGEQVTFDVTVSVYYKQEGFSVVANTTVVKPDDKGHYTFTVIGNTTVQVKELVMDDPFSDRVNADDEHYVDGEGTAENPYKIRKPIDLYAMADLIGDTYYVAERYHMAYYELMNDIDLKGERLYIIGDSTSETSIFAGNFNGNNHTVSNYYIADQITDQETFQGIFTPYIGFFGIASATSLGPAEIYDLNLDNFTVEVSHTNKSFFYAGGLVGFASGVNITNCSANGKITAAADDELRWRNAMGGLVGSLMAVSDGVVSYNSVVRSCSANVEVGGESGVATCIGGLVGQVGSYSTSVPSYVLNSYATGDVYGAIYTGGIVGELGAFGSVKNCYSTGAVEAVSRVSDMVNGGDYRYANAGGIAGYADHGAIISDCFATGTTDATARLGSSYRRTGGIAAYTEVDAVPAASFPALVRNSYSRENNVTFDTQFIQNTLKWDNVDWTFADGYPTVNKEIVRKTYTVTVKINGSAVKEVELTDVYAPMSDLYAGIYVENNEVLLPEYLTSGATARTYGYYFDEACEVRIPDSFVPTYNMEIFAKYTDYSEVAGRYYIQSAETANRAGFRDYKSVRGVNALSPDTTIVPGAYFELGTDGKLIFRNGVINSESTWYYDGTRATLKEAYVTFQEYGTGETDADNNVLTAIQTVYASFYAVKNGANLSIYDGDFYAESKPLSAVAAVDGFTYGYYYETGGAATYLFNPDMSGEKTDGNVTARFEYTVSGSQINTGSEVINLSSLTAFDPLYGTWEKSAGSNKQFTFDGKGHYTYDYFGYNASGNKTSYQQGDGTYNASTGAMAGFVNGTVTLSDGLLVIEGETYYKQNSLVGTWRYPGGGRYGSVEITFGGISALGYGDAVINYGASYGNLRVGYHAITNAQGAIELELYNYDYRYGSLIYTPAEKTLRGNVIASDGVGAIGNATFYLYDDYKGSWVSNDGDLYLLNFNGWGNYDVHGAADLNVSGTISITNEQAVEVKGSYTLKNGTLEGTFTYNGVVYNLFYIESTNLIRVAPQEGGADVILYGQDGWQDTVLVANDGTEYAFDGRGYVQPSGGKVTVKAAGGATSTLGYTVAANGTVTIGGSVLGVANGNYTLNGTALWIKSLFVGTWKYIDDGVDKEITIGKIGPKGDGYGVNVTYDGKTVSASYDLDAKEIYIAENGNVTLGIMNLNLKATQREDTALNFAVIINNQAKSFVCIDEFDVYKGEYVSAAGKKLVFDGYGVSEYEIGEVKSCNQNGDPVAVKDDAKYVSPYSYSLEGDEIMLSGTEIRPVYDDEGKPELDDKGKPKEKTEIIRYLLRETAQSGNATYEGNGKYYELIEVDALYGYSAIRKSGHNDFDDTVTYEFDGIGGFVGPDESGAATHYAYSIIGNYDDLKMEYKLYVVAEDGRIYAGVFNMSSFNSLSLEEKDKFYNLKVYGVDKDGKVDGETRYVFDGLNVGSLTYVKGQDMAIYEYKFLDEKDGVCTFEVVSTADRSKKYKGALTYGKNGEKNTFTLEEVKA